MTEWPENRLSIDGFFDETEEGANKLRSRGAHFVKRDPASFDAPFFSTTAKDAAAMDPQQRWALEGAYHAFENAGIPMTDLKNSRMAVYGSSMSDDYSRMLTKDLDTAPRMAMTGIQPSILANRISWYYGLLGPSISIDTACSSSMVSIDLACQCLQNGEATSALVFGSNLMFTPDNSLMLANMNFTSPDSVCWSFDARANGYARGEGIICMILKPLSAAVRDGDLIRAVIRSSGCNQDGHTPGLTQPSVESQEALIKHVYEKAQLDYGLTRYVEAHGTGTAIGDPIEMEAIGRVFRSYRSEQDPLYVGSIKANIGHLEAASGLAGILKSILILEKGLIPPNALFETINPRIDLQALRTQVPTETIKWPSNGIRRVSVNSFGFGGTNSHVVLESAPQSLEAQGLECKHRCEDKPLAEENLPLQPNGHCLLTNTHPRPVELDGHSSGTHPRLLVWTASNEKAASRMTNDAISYFDSVVQGNNDALSNWAYTLAARREQMEWRTFAVASTGHDAETATRLVPEKPVQISPQAKNLAFIFTGQGAQYLAMGSALLEYSVFKDYLQKCDEVFRSMGCTWSIFDELHNADHIHRPEYSQPLCTALQVALVELLRSCGVAPQAVVGHSSGEIAAAYTIGALSLQSACKIAYLRGLVTMVAKEASQEAPGAMLSVNLAEEDIPVYLENPALEPLAHKILVACVNSPSNCTVAGDEKTIDALKMQLDKDKIFSAKLNTGVAYHTPMMDQVAGKYLELLGGLGTAQTDKTGVTMASSVTGRLVSPKLLSTAQYWVNNLTSQVRFSEAVAQLMTSDTNLGGCVEIGPHSALQWPIRDITSQETFRGRNLWYRSALIKSKSSHSSILTLIGHLFCHGHPVSLLEANMQAAEAARGALLPLRDCPKYPFDHSHKFWFETRFSRDFRHRVGTSSYVLGQRSHDWNPLEPKWRNFLYLDSMPWLGDHEVNGRILYPGTGMLVMAMEAAKEAAKAKERETSSKSRRITGYYIKEARFLKPIIVGETVEQATETVTHLRPLRQTYEKEASCYEISIFAIHESRWDECFKATVRIEYQERITQVDGGKETRLENEHVLETYENALASNTASLNPSTFYSFCKRIGIDYGKSFQLLSDIRYKGDHSSTARVDISKAVYQVSELVHPTVLDAAHHLVMAQMSQWRLESVPTMVPYQLKNAWVSATGWDSQSTSHVRFVSLSRTGLGKLPTESTLYGLAEDGSMLCAMERVIMSPISRGQVQDTRPERLLHSISLKPLLSLMEPHELEQVCAPRDAPLTPHRIEAMECYKRLDIAMVKAIDQAMSGITDADLQNAPAHIRHYAAIMRDYLKDGFRAGGSKASINQNLETLLQICERELPELEMTSIVARNLPQILAGSVDPLELVFSTDCAERLYRDMFHLVFDERLRRFLDLACHENPGMRILEVGAGTGGVTEHVLSAIRDFEKETGAILFSEYVYTDISAGFLDNARTKFRDFEERMVFRTLDLQRDANQQGFELAGYDMVIAGSVLHATPDLIATLTNVRSLLKPGGRLINLEMVIPHSPCLNVTFGVLPGWWLSKEDWRATSPLITEQEWDSIAQETGFSGNDLVIRDFDSEVWHVSSIIVSTAVDTARKIPEAEQITVIADLTSEEQRMLASLLSTDLNAQVLSLEDAVMDGALGDQGVVLYLLELDKPWLATISEQDFPSLQGLIQRVQKLLWVTSSSVDDPLIPFNGVMKGFLRSIRSESAEKRIATLNIEAKARIPVTKCLVYIRKVLEHAFASARNDFEFIVQEDGLLSTERLVEDIPMNEDHQSRLVPKSKVESWLPGPALVLGIESPGELDSLHFVEDPMHQEPLGLDEVEIEARVWSVSFKDIFVALGRLSIDEGFGFECSGTVTRVGAQAASEYKPGDRVCITSPGSMRTYPRAKTEAVFHIPEGISFEKAASIINPGSTAYHGLVNLARLQKGDKVLIHSAAGSTGQMAVSLAKMIGAEIFATVGFERKKKLLVEEYGIPPDHIFYSRNTSFAKGIRRLTNGYGVDVVLNSLSGDSLRASWECMAPYGRFVEIGKSDIMNNSSLPMSGFAKNISFFAIDLYHIAKTRMDIARPILLSLMSLLKEGKIEYPKPIIEYPVSNVEGAFRFIQSGQNTGRTVIKIDRSEVVSKMICSQEKLTFRPDATYLVIGGLGGLGRAIVRWMSRQGARHLILPSRSGAASQPAKQVVQELESLGVTVAAPRCDAASMADLSRICEECAKTMPPIAGCINAAMVLQDAVFTNMTHAQWERTIRSKVQVSWNLHQLFPKLDFLVFLASLSGILGSVGQANYSAGCTFQDALARYRTSLGQSTISLDLGWMRTIGIIAENEKFQRYRQDAQNMVPLEEEELLAVLDLCCQMPSQRSALPASSQVLMGATTPAAYAARGEAPDPSVLQPLFSTFARMTKSANQSHTSPKAGDYGKMFKEATDADERAKIFTTALAAKLARALSIAAEDVKVDKQLTDYGIDSLMAVELRNWIGKEFKAQLAVFDIMGGVTVKGIGSLVAAKSGL